MSSPGFKGYVPLQFELVYWDTTDTVNYAEVSSPGVITGEADETTGNYGHKVKITIDPKFASTMAPDTLYTLYINGDPDTTETGVAARTVFDVEAAGGNTGNAEVSVYGTYSGISDDTLHVRVTAAGNIGTAEYKWWWAGSGVGSAITGRVTNRRFRNLDLGLQLRFTGSDLQVGDEWTVNVETISRMLTSTSVSFTTNDGSYSAAPSSPSTPASSSPPSSVLPSNADPFDVLYMEPPNGSYNVDVNNRIITIVFTDDIDPLTITDESVILWKYPAEGFYQQTWRPIELQKSLSVSGDTLTIRY